MSPSDPPLPTIDYASLSFPSDHITLADIRRAHPDRFDTEDGRRFKSIELEDKSFTVSLIIHLEHLLARAAFEKAAGLPGNVLHDVGLLEREECIEELTGFYQAYGVAQGPQHTEMLVRDLEARAASQAAKRGR